MSESDTKEALAITIRELGKQNEELQRRINVLLRRPKDSRVTSACLGFVQVFGSRLLFQAQPQVVFRPERFCVSKDCAPYYRIIDIRVGMSSQFIAPHAIPASLFAVENVHRLREIDLEDEFDAAIPMTYDVAHPGQFITIEVQVVRAASEPPFECVMTGDVLDSARADFPKGPLTLTTKKTTEN